MKQSDDFRENADNCAQLAERATDEPTHQRYKRMERQPGVPLRMSRIGLTGKHLRSPGQPMGMC
jgi:hypothetical protein